MSHEAVALCFLAGANSIFTGEKLLTTPNPAADEDEAMLQESGHEGDAACLNQKIGAFRPTFDGASRTNSKLCANESQLRTLETPDGINLCSNDYLGLAVDPRLKRAVIEAVAQRRSGGFDRFAAAFGKFARMGRTGVANSRSLPARKRRFISVRAMRRTSACSARF